MSRKFCLYAVVLLAAMALSPIANAQAHYIGVGSSAMFNGFSYASYNDLILAKSLTNATNATPPGHCPVGDTCVAKHWSIKNGGECVDTRTAGGVSPVAQVGNIWITWVEDSTTATALDAWTYLSVDSTVGLRCFLARPTTNLVITSAVGTAGANIISSNGQLYTDGSLDSAYDAPIATLLNQPAGIPFTAGMTDIRPEDGVLATKRILGDGAGSLANGCSVADTSDTVPTPLDPYGSPCWYIYSFALGYAHYDSDPPGANGIGANIVTGISGTSAAQPVIFGLPGFNDPLSGAAVPATIKTFAVGESPILFVTNRTNKTTGLGQPIGTYVAAGNCYGAGLTACEPNNTGQPTTFVTDGSYYVRNVWDQHPWPGVDHVPPAIGGGVGVNPADPDGNSNCNSSTWPGGAGFLSECTVTRRPLGNFFSGGDCEGDNSSFAWPLVPGNTQGLRAQIPNRQAFPVTLYLREPLSGTYNTTEFTEMRRFGTPWGSMDGVGSTPDPGPSAGPEPYVAGNTFARAPYISQEGNVVASNGAPDNPLNKQCQADAGEAVADATGVIHPASNEGTRVRAIGTGQVISGVSGVGGVLNQADAIGYTFFGFGNVQPLATAASTFPNANYGYLMIDAVDPLFDNYENAIPGGAPAPVSTANGNWVNDGIGPNGPFNVEGEPACEGGAAGPTGGAQVPGSCLFSAPYPASQEPGQPAGNAAFGNAGNALSWGELPACGGAGQPVCTTSHIWHTTVAADQSTICPTGTACSFPHVRDGSYSAWSELRLLCDSALATCGVGTDALGAEALLQNLQHDIHFNATAPSGAGYGVPDLLPMDDAGSFANGNTPYGDVYYIRDHYAYVAADDTNLHNPPFAEFASCGNVTTHQSNVQVQFGGGATGCTLNTPKNGPVSGECGGDAGGYIRSNPTQTPANVTSFYTIGGVAQGSFAPGCTNSNTGGAVTGIVGDLQ